MSKSYAVRIARTSGRLSAIAMAALLTSACAGSQLSFPVTGLASNDADAAPITTGSIEQRPLADVSAADALGDLASQPPPVAEAIERSRKLRANGKKAEAFAVLTKAAELAPDNAVLQRERGLLAADLGRLDDAEKLLTSAIDPARPDWRTKSALGSVLAAKGRHGEAQRAFAEALALAPNHPSVLNNLALSYALDGKHERAENLLQQAANTGAGEATKQNLALLRRLRQTDPAQNAGTGVNTQVSRAPETAANNVRAALAPGQ